MGGMGNVRQWGIAGLTVAAILGFVALDSRRTTDRTTDRATSTPGSGYSTYENPVDGTVIEANWQTYESGGNVSSGAGMQPEHRSIMLLSSEKVIERNMTVEALVTFMRGVEGALDTATTESSASYRLLVQVSLFPADAPRYEFFTVGEAPQGDRQRILASLEMITPLYTARETVKLQLWYFTDHR